MSNMKGILGGAGAGATIGTLGSGPLLAATFAAFSGPLAPVTAPLGFGIGCLLPTVTGAVIGNKVVEIMDGED